MSDIRIGSWTELTERLFDDSWRPSISRFRSPYVFRGTSSSGHDLSTSLQTAGLVPSEHHLLRDFRKYALLSPVGADSVWNWLSLAKHHGLPTRLLDWSYSPYVALHFVTQDIGSFDRDGSVWAVNYVKTNELLPASLRSMAERESAGIFSAEMLDEVAHSLQEFDRLSSTPFVAFFEPPSLDDRIVNQFALFSVGSPATLRLDELFEGRPGFYRRLIIPSALKWEIRDKLDQANITERVLFPGLDGISDWLRRYYTRRNPSRG